MSNPNVIEGEVLHNNLPYRFVPDDTINRPIKSNNIINRIMNYQNSYHITQKQVKRFILIWTILAILLSTISSTLFHAGVFNIIINNIFTGALIIGAMNHKNYVRLPCAIVGALWIISANTGLNAAVMLVTLIVAVYFTRRKIGYYNFGGSKYSNMGKCASIPDSMVSVWGIAGSHIAGANYGEAGKVGSKGEEIVGERLDKLARDFPFVRIFNGVRFTPGVDGADVDHVVLIGNKIYFVDAKFWAITSYYWDISGSVYRNGGPFNGGDVHMDAAMQQWGPLVNQYGVLHSRITLCIPEYNNKYQIDNRNAPNNIYVVTLNELMDELYHVAGKETDPYVDRRLVHIIANELQK